MSSLRSLESHMYRDLDKAIETMRLGQENDPNYWTHDYSNPNVFKLVDYLENDGQLNEAITTLEQVREKNPEYWKTDYNRICALYQKSGNTEKSTQRRTELIKIYEELKTSDKKLYYRLTGKLASMYLGEVQIEKAIKVLEEGRANYDYFPIKNNVTLAGLYQQVGDIDKAKKTYQDAINEYRECGMHYNIRYVVNEAKAHGIEISIT